MKRHVLWVFLLGGCFNPDLSSKPCLSNMGCPSGYFCDPSRPSPGANGLCSSGAGVSDAGGIPTDLLNAGTEDMVATIQPPVLSEYVIPGNLFTLGSNQADQPGSNDAPAYQRAMGSICVQEKEVTVAAYTLCVQAGKCSKPVGNNASCNYGVAGRESHPINCVEFPQAQAFCSWTNRRLPTESEWEYAANGATASTGEKYPWVGAGGAFDATKACFNTNGTCPVGSKTRTYLGSEVVVGTPGFYDFAGNVNEWTSSEFCPYAPPTTDRVCGSLARVVRGGSGFDTNYKILRSTFRLGNAKDAASANAMYPTAWHQNLGFRCFGDVDSGTCVQ